MKIIISLITTFLLLFFIFMIIYLFPDKKNVENFSNSLKNKIKTYSITIEEPIEDSLIPYNPYAKIHLDEYQIIETFKYILKRTPTIQEINKFIYYTSNELKEYLYNSSEYEKLIKVQDNIVNNGIEAAVAKKNLINRIMELYKTIYNNDVPVKMILPLRDCFIYLQLNIYMFMVMLEHTNYPFFEDSVLTSYILTKKILYELFNKYFNILELKIYAEEKISKLSSINDTSTDSYMISKIEIANIIKDLIVINNDYLLIKIKSNYPAVFYEILNNTIGSEKLSTDNSDIINLKKFLNNLNQSSYPNIISTLPPTPPPIPRSTSSPPTPPTPPPIPSQNRESDDITTVYSFSGFANKESFENNNKTIFDYYAFYKKNKDNMNPTDRNYYDDYYKYDFYYYLRNSTDYSNKSIFDYYDEFKKFKDNMSINNTDYYNDLYSQEFNDYLAFQFSNTNNDDNNIQVFDLNANVNNNEVKYVNLNGIINNNINNKANTDLPFRGNYMNDLIYDEDNKSVLRLYNPIVHNKSYLLPSGYKPPVCTSLGQEQLTQPVFTESKLLFQGLDIDKAFTETQVGSIMPKFIYNEFNDIRIK